MTTPAYQAPLWLRGSHAQTLWPLAIKGGMPEVVRERWELPDGDFIDVDRLPVRAGKPLVLMFHGLEGSSRSHYTRALLRTLEARGWNGAVPHFRGCSGEPNRKLRAYHSGDAAEIDWILRRFAERYPDVPRYASGVSLGGNALLVWLGQQGDGAKSVLSAAAAISAPLDLAACGHHLARGFNQIYSLNFLATMKRNALAKLERFPWQLRWTARQGRAPALRIRRDRHRPAARFRERRGLLDARLGQTLARSDRAADPVAQRPQRSLHAGRRAADRMRSLALGHAGTTLRGRSRRFRRRPFPGQSGLATPTPDRLSSNRNAEAPAIGIP